MAKARAVTKINQSCYLDKTKGILELIAHMTMQKEKYHKS